MWTATGPHYTISARMRASRPAVTTRGAPSPQHRFLRPARMLSAIAAISAFAAVWLAAQPARRTVSLVVIGGTVITQNASRQVFSPGAVAIDGATILDVDRPEV